MARRANATSFGGIKGNKPGASGAHGLGGATPETFKARMRLLASREKTVKNVEKVLDDAYHRQFAKVLEFAADRGYGKPVSAEDVKARVAQTVASIRRHCSESQAAAILAEIRPLWL